MKIKNQDIKKQEELEIARELEIERNRAVWDYALDVAQGHDED